MCPLPNLRFTTPKTAFLGGGAAEGVPPAAAERRPREKKPPGQQKTRFCTQKNALRTRKAAHIRPGKPTTACRRPVIPPSRSSDATASIAPRLGSYCRLGHLQCAALRPPRSRCDQGGARAGTAAAPRRAGRAAARTTAAVAAAARAARTGATATAASRGRRRRGRGVRARSPEAARAASAEQSCAAGSSPPCPASACGPKNRPPYCWCSSTGNGGALRGGSAHPPPWMGANEST